MATSPPPLDSEASTETSTSFFSKLLVELRLPKEESSFYEFLGKQDGEIAFEMKHRLLERLRLHKRLLLRVLRSLADWDQAKAQFRDVAREIVSRESTTTSTQPLTPKSHSVKQTVQGSSFKKLRNLQIRAADLVLAVDRWRSTCSRHNTQFFVFPRTGSSQKRPVLRLLLAGLKMIHRSKAFLSLTRPGMFLAVPTRVDNKSLSSSLLFSNVQKVTLGHSPHDIFLLTKIVNHIRRAERLLQQEYRRLAHPKKACPSHDGDFFIPILNFVSRIPRQRDQWPSMQCCGGRGILGIDIVPKKKKVRRKKRRFVKTKMSTFDKALLLTKKRAVSSPAPGVSPVPKRAIRRRIRKRKGKVSSSRRNPTVHPVPIISLDVAKKGTDEWTPADSAFESELSEMEQEESSTSPISDQFVDDSGGIADSDGGELTEALDFGSFDDFECGDSIETDCIGPFGLAEVAEEAQSKPEFADTESDPSGSIDSIDSDADSLADSDSEELAEAFSFGGDDDFEVEEPIGNGCGDSIEPFGVGEDPEVQPDFADTEPGLKDDSDSDSGGEDMAEAFDFGCDGDFEAEDVIEDGGDSFSVGGDAKADDTTPASIGIEAAPEFDEYDPFAGGSIVTDVPAFDQDDFLGDSVEESSDGGIVGFCEDSPETTDLPSFFCDDEFEDA